jgi:hypothetical protein
MNHPSALIDELVKTHLKPALKELGFKSKSSTFFRQNGELVEIISPQKSSWNDANESKFTINLGVYWPKIHEILGGPIASLPPKEYECTIRQRLGSLFDNGKDFWWSVSPNSDIGQIGADVVEKVRHYGLPWLVRATSLDEAIKIAQPRQAIVFLALKGEHAQATALIEEQLAKNKHAKAFFRLLATKLELKISTEL